MEYHHLNENIGPGFISSFIADIIGFGAALLTIIMALVVIYIVTGHSKLKTLVANIALQCIKTVEAVAPNPNHIICESGLVKIYLVIHLAIVILVALAILRKSRIFKGKLFSNTIKVTLFVADNHCYIPLHLNKLAGRIYTFLNYMVCLPKKSSPKEKLDMECFGNRLDRCALITGP